MSLVAVAAHELKRHGRPVTLRRISTAAGVNSWTPGVVTETFVTAYGRFRKYRPQEVKGQVQEGDVLCVLDPKIGVIPAVGDYVAAGTFTVAAGAVWLRIVSPPYSPEVGDQVALHRLQCRK